VLEPTGNRRRSRSFFARFHSWSLRTASLGSFQKGESVVDQPLNDFLLCRCQGRKLFVNSRCTVVRADTGGTEQVRDLIGQRSPQIGRIRNLRIL
jgi:hypothetical protein